MPVFWPISLSGPSALFGQPPQKRDSDFSPTPQALGKSLTLSGPLLANLGNQKVKGDYEVPFGLRAIKLHTLFPGRLF